MKKLLIMIISFFIMFSFVNISEANDFEDLFSRDSGTTINICNWDECGLTQWMDLIKNWGIDWVVTEWKASEYIQDIIVYVLTFLKLIAVIIIIYAWFNMLTSAWDEEKAKTSKTMITFTIIWLAIIYLAGPITTFVLDIFSQR